MRTLAIALLLCLAASLAAQAADSTGYRPGDRSLFLCPTSTTLPAKNLHITLYELILIDLTFSPIKNVELGVFIPPPIIPEMLRLSAIHGKWSVYNEEKWGAALYSYWAPSMDILLAGTALSVRNSTAELHFAPSFGSVYELDATIALLAGMKLHLNTHTDAMCEVFTFTKKPMDEDITVSQGLILGGFRWSFTKAHLTLGGMVPLEKDKEGDGFSFMPFLEISWPMGRS